MNHKVLISQDKILTRVVFLCLFFVPVVLLLLSSCTRDDAGSGLDKPGSEIKILVSSGSSSLTKGEPSSFGSASESGSVSGSESSSESSSFGVAPVSYELYYNLTTGEQSENSLLLSEHSSDSTSSESLAHDFTKFSIVIEPNDGQFYYGSNASYSSVSDGSTTASSDPNQISSSTHYDNNGGNHYSSGGKKYDRLVWDAGDELSIWSDKAKTLSGQPQEIYKIVGSPSNSGGESKATVMPKSAGLLWGSGSHHFVGLYPVSDNVSTSSDLVYKDYNFSNSQSAVYSGSDGVYLPELNKYGIMSAHTSVDAPSNSLAFKFYPQFTALEFNLIGEDGYELTVKGVTISSTSHYLASNGGTINNYRVGRDISKPTDGSSVISFTPSADDATCSKSVSLSFVDANGDPATPILSHTQPLCFTVLLSGVEDLSNLKVNLSVDVKNTSSGDVATDKHRVLTLSRGGTPITIPACSKVLISNLEVPSVWFYEFFVTDPTDLTYYGRPSHPSGGAGTATITSYRRNAETGAEEPVGWSVEGYYKTREDALSKTSRIAAGDSPESTSLLLSDFRKSATTPGSNVTTHRFSYKASRIATTRNISVHSISAARIKANGIVGSTANFFNLANPKGEVGPDFIKETANTYIVNAEGYYRIPLVMGNGVKNNQPNTQAISSNFQDYKGNAITSPYLHSVGTPTKGIDLTFAASKIENDYITGNQKRDANNNQYSNLQLSGSSVPVISYSNGVYWLNFHVKTPAPGLAVLAVLDENDIVMWSWSIWITDYVPFNYPDYESSPDKDIELTSFLDSTDPEGTPLKVHVMPRNLCSIYGLGDLYSFPEDELYVRYEQSESGKIAVMRIYKPGHTPPETITEIPFYEGDVSCRSAYYVWGRKDPIGLYLVENLYDFSGSNYDIVASGEGKSTGYEIYETIQKPGISLERMTTNPTTTGYNTWQTSSIKTNLWCINPVVNGDTPTRKTIYDPSPVGYTVPRTYAFRAFGAALNGPPYYLPQYANAKGSWQRGVYLYNKYTSSEPGTGSDAVVYFPATGYTCTPYVDWGQYFYRSQSATGAYSWCASPGYSSTWEYRAAPYLLIGYCRGDEGIWAPGTLSTTYYEVIGNETMHNYGKPIRCTRDEYYDDGIAGSVGGVDVNDFGDKDGGKLKF